MTKLGTIYNCDCVEGLKKLTDCSIDCCITSPPYDDLRTYGGSIDAWNLEKAKSVATELYRVLKDGGIVVWVIGDATKNGSETLTSFKHVFIFTEVGFRLHDTMIYYKDNPCPVGGKNRYYQAFEYMFVFSKGSPKTFNPLTEPRRNKYQDKRTERIKGFQRNADGEMVPKYTKINQGDPKRRNVWLYSLGASDHTGHPAVFPYKLAADHILSWTNEGDVVLDPFMGSGTTAVACIALNRKYIGFEVNKEYCEQAEQRINKILKK